jgi:hypothetical protein
VTTVRRNSSLVASLGILLSVATACGSSISDSTTTIAVSGTVAGIGNLPAQDLGSETDSANQSSVPPGSRPITVGEISSGPRLLMIGDSIQSISSLNEIDFFIHDSDHSPEHEKNELEAIESKLSSNAFVLSDNSHVTDELYNWSKKMGRKYLFIKEVPKDHWYGGAGVGISY